MDMLDPAADAIPRKWAITDAIGPFFRGNTRRRINWSKIPFVDLPVSGETATPFWSRLKDDLGEFASRVRRIGFDAVTLDDVAHLVVHPDYEPDVRARSAIFIREFQAIIPLLESHGLRVFVTSDFLTIPQAVEGLIGRNREAARLFFCETLELFFESFPTVSGVVLRVGESDGVDVRDPLRSRLIARSDVCVNDLLHECLPIFERRNKTLIFRTWTVGASLLGDLMWNRGRLENALAGIASRALIVSMKPGESDFFRYLQINQQFFQSSVPKLIELQARREYEGAGEFPAFSGWEYESYRRALEGVEGIVGISVWCQTGGWHKFRRLTFVENSSPWVELNMSAACEIFLNGRSVRDAVVSYFGRQKAGPAMEFLKLVEVVILRLLYIEEFARLTLFFRRVRVPPLIHVYWDAILIVDPIRQILRSFVSNPLLALQQGEEAFGYFPRIRQLAEELGLPIEDVDFMRDSMEMVLWARRFFFKPLTSDMMEKIIEAKVRYKMKWPDGGRPRYRIKTFFDASALRRHSLRWLLRILLRRRRNYRLLLDRIFTLKVLSWAYVLFAARNTKALPKLLRKSAMGFDAVMR